MSPVTCRWLRAFLWFHIVSSYLPEVSTVEGCPQGGVLSPLSWNLVVDDILSQITYTGTHIQSYADDQVIMVGGKFPEIVADIMNERLKEVLHGDQENYRLIPRRPLSSLLQGNKI